MRIAPTGRVMPGGCGGVLCPTMRRCGLRTQTTLLVGTVLVVAVRVCLPREEYIYVSVNDRLNYRQRKAAKSSYRRKIMNIILRK